jgi:predicted glycoside hydrolase/deacetylase ChbG (UPF0249 family)
MEVEAKKYLIVNADDFGLSSGVSRGIIEAHEQGIVTSASLMVRWPGAAEAAAESRKYPNLSLGLHLDLSEWAYRDGIWVPLYEVVPVDEISAVADEVTSQLATFRQLVGKNPTHLDSHQHTHLEEPVRSLVIEVARRLAIPLRCCSLKIHYCGQFYGQTAEGFPLPDAVSVDALIGILENVPVGLTELSTHPGYPVGLDTMYCSERVMEVHTLCDPRVRAAVIAMGIELCSFDTTVALLEEPDERAN